MIEFVTAGKYLSKDKSVFTPTVNIVEETMYDVTDIKSDVPSLSLIIMHDGEIIHHLLLKDVVFWAVIGARLVITQDSSKVLSLLFASKFSAEAAEARLVLIMNGNIVN